MEQGKSTQPFDNSTLDYYVGFPSDPRKSIGYNEDYIRRLYQNLDFELIEPVRFGTWRRLGSDSSNYQDMIVTKKKWNIRKYVIILRLLDYDSARQG